MSHHITTHNEEGKAIFTPSTLHHPLNIPIGTLTTLYTTTSFPQNLSSDSTDVDQYLSSRTTLHAPGQICPPNGTSVLLMDIAPGAGNETGSVMHRTMTLDVVLVLEGEIELELDEGETRKLAKGDCVVQRATMHRWVNVTPAGGWAKMVVFAQAIQEPVRVGEQDLRAEWK